MTSRRAQRRNPKVPARVVIAGDNIVAAEMGDKFEAVQRNDLPPKRLGHHRWVATAAFTMTDEAVSGAYDKTVMKFLDHENMFHLAIGCWDCEAPLGDPAKGGIRYGSPCPSPGED